MGKPEGRDLGMCANVLRTIFVIFNVVGTLIGLGTIGVGIYNIVSNKRYEFITGNSYLSSAIILIVVGFFVALVAIAGIIGAIARKKLLLAIYAGVWIIVIILEIVAVGLSFGYSERVTENAENRYRDGWEKAIKEYSTDSAAKDAVDTIQENGECCGLDNATNWLTLNPDYFRSNNYSFPESCSCDEDATSDNCNANYTVEFEGEEYVQSIFDRGCYDATVDYIQYIQRVSAIVGIVFVVFEIIGVLMALGVCYCINKAEKKYESV